MKKYGRIILTGMLLLSVSLAAADVQVTASLDQTRVGLNQQFTLQVELSGKDASKAGNPELPAMESFAAFLGSGSSQNISFVNGKMSQTKIISYHFQATAQGSHVIGPVKVTVRGREYSTEPITLEVTDAPASSSRPSSGRQNTPTQGQGPAEGDLYIRTLVNKKTVYQGEPVIVTYKIYTRVDVSSYGFTNLPGTAGFWVEEFPIGRQPQTAHEVIDGKQYVVATIRKTALFPMSPGEKRLEPVGIECEVRTRRRSRDLFDDFFSDPFGRTVRKQITSKPVTIHVKPLPSEGRPADFAGWVGQYSVKAIADKRQVKTNEAITYKVTIKGNGHIQGIGEPQITFPGDFEVYPPKTSDQMDRSNNRISGSKTFEYVLIPRSAGDYDIPALSLAYFDPAAGQYKTASAPGIRLNVQQGDETYAVTHTGLSKEEVKLVGQDIRFIKTAAVFRSIHRSVWSGLMSLLAVAPLLLLGASVFYRRHLDRLDTDVAYARQRQAGRFARKRLSTARSFLKLETQKEFYAETGKALMGYLGNKLNIAEAGMITDEVLTLLEKRGVSLDARVDLADALRVCDMQRFAPSDSSEEEMRAFLKKAEETLMRLNKELK